ncbi:hypothetical protein [Aquimarina sp. RZ0]|uniref:hypothetical protein n=1 Tax=Aquimarina sp. RZ0 TaxID=2607730 RepID=UPI0011F0C38D|nr:hypothetical protein [Aquimarina sp. RZ0]KAA1243030.1 hypothetical protein F0000_22980 [Aquimarina sp. RZ0]
MKSFYQYSFTFCILVLMYGCASYAPTNNKLSGVLSKSEQVILNLSEKILQTKDDDLIVKYNALEEKYKELFPVLENCNKKYGLTTNYVLTLQEAQKALERLDKGFAITQDRVFILDAIYQDYDAKLQSILSSAQNDANTKIRVTVNSSVDDGFFVFGKLSYENKLDIKRFRFNKPTQNASQDFVPGYYLFWLEKEDRIGEAELHLILSNGKEEVKQLVLKTPK